jgi:hypothetical protein
MHAAGTSCTFLSILCVAIDKNNLSTDGWIHRVIIKVKI